MTLFVDTDSWFHDLFHLLQNFYDSIEGLDPDNGDHLLVCLGGDYTESAQSNLPYRGIDSTFQSRWCSNGTAILDPDTGLPIGVNLTTPDELCNHYSQEEIKHIPHITQNVQAALDFLGKDDDGFFLMYEQGDVSLYHYQFYSTRRSGHTLLTRPLITLYTPKLD